MIIIERNFPRHERKEFASVSDLTKWAMDYALNKGCDMDAYVRIVYNGDELEEIIDDQEYTLGELFYDGWREVKE